MIQKKTHEKLVKLWEKVGPGVYQRWNRLTTRMPLFLKYVKHLEGKKVIEFGCNAGMYGYEISKVAEQYTGVDQGDYYIKQAKITKRELKMDNAEFHCRFVKGFLRDVQKGKRTVDINAIFASFVLYHLSDKETDMIQEMLLPNCDVVLILTRTSKRSGFKKYNSRKLHKISNVEKYLEESGFECESEMHDSGKFGITLARRPDADNKGESDGDKEGDEQSPRGRSSQGIDEDGIHEGGEVLHAERGVDAEGTDSVLPPAQDKCGSEGVLQGGQRGVPSVESEGGEEGVEKEDEAGTVQGNADFDKDCKGESGPEIPEEED